MSGEIYSLTSTPNNRFFRNVFMVGLFTLRIFARNLLRGNRQRNIYFSYFVLISVLDQAGQSALDQAGQSVHDQAGQSALGQAGQSMHDQAGQSVHDQAGQSAIDQADQ